MYQDHLILPLFLLFYHPVIPAPPPLQKPFQKHLRQPTSLPPPHKVNLKVCKVVLLCVSTSCGHCVLNQRKIRDTVETNDRILAPSV